jgi:hypothetical protein
MKQFCRGVLIVAVLAVLLVPEAGAFHKQTHVYIDAGRSDRSEVYINAGRRYSSSADDMRVLGAVALVGLGVGLLAYTGYKLYTYFTWTDARIRTWSAHEINRIARTWDATVHLCEQQADKQVLIEELRVRGQTGHNAYPLMRTHDALTGDIGTLESVLYELITRKMYLANDLFLRAYALLEKLNPIVQVIYASKDYQQEVVEWRREARENQHQNQCQQSSTTVVVVN